MTLAHESRGDGFPMVCLPWFSLDRSTLATALEPALAPSGEWRRIYVDLPGTGDSPGGTATSDAVVDEVVQFIDDVLGPELFALVGCSYGGYVASGVTRRIPDRIRGLALICSGVKILPTERELPPEPATPAPAQWRTHVPDRFQEHLATALGNHSVAVAGRVAQLLMAAPPGNQDFLTRLRSTGYQLSDEGVPVEFRGPTTVLTGRQDHVGGYADQLRALVHYPDSSFAVVADAGHYLPFEQPAVFGDLMAHWTGRVV